MTSAEDIGSLYSNLKNYGKIFITICTNILKFSFNKELIFQSQVPAFPQQSYYLEFTLLIFLNKKLIIFTL